MKTLALVLIAALFMAETAFAQKWTPPKAAWGDPDQLQCLQL